MGVCIPRSSAGRVPTSSRTSSCSRRSRGPTQASGVTVAVHTSAVTLPILTFGTDEQRSRFVPPLAARRADRGVRADRDGGGLRCRVAADVGRARRRRLADLGDEAVHLHRRVRGDIPPVCAHRPGHARCARRFRLHPRRRPRPRHRPRGEAGPQLLGHELDRGRGCARRRRPDAARRGQGLHRCDGDARRRPDRHRRAGARHRAGAPTTRLARTRWSAGSSASGSPTSRRSSGSSRTWRPRSTPRGCCLPRRLAEAAGQAAHGGGREGEALRVRDGAARRRPRRSRSSAAMATRRSSRSSATTATPRSRRSTRGRARSSGS